MNDFSVCPDAPSTFSAQNVVIRLLQTIGYRYRCSLIGVTDDMLNFKPEPSAMTLGELQEHIFNLIDWVQGSIVTDDEGLHFSVENTFVHLKHIIQYFEQADVDLSTLSIGEKSFMHAINGPLSDSLTHIGQINTYKRISGVENRTKGYF